MARELNRLSTVKIDKANPARRRVLLADGGGLYLQVTAGPHADSRRARSKLGVVSRAAGDRGRKGRFRWVLELPKAA